IFCAASLTEVSGLMTSTSLVIISRSCTPTPRFLPFFFRLWRIHYVQSHGGRRVSDRSPRAPDAVIRVYDETGNVIETHKHAGDFKQIGRFRGLGPKAGWLSCSVLTQTASVRQEIDCKMPPNYS